MRTFVTRVWGCLLMALAGTVAAFAADMDTELLAIQQAWAVANYETPAGDARKHALETLSEQTELFAQKYPHRAEPLIWKGIVLSSYAGAKGGLGALGIAKQSRAALEAALQIDPLALQGSAYTSLGTLYYKVPGFPLGFGDEAKAQEYLQKALAINPHGIDPNYFYGELLFEQKHYAEAQRHLQTALQAPARPGRELADRGRQQEIRTLLAKVSERG